MNLLPGNVYLIGLMGAGKTTVGRKLAELMKADFIDTDQPLEKRTGVSIAHIFEIEGEQGFRDRESRLFEEVSSENNVVVSTGGGLVLNMDNRARMKQSGEVVYLRANIEILWKRLKNCHTRPLLQTPNPRSRIEELIVERDPVYTEMADHIVEVTSGSANKTAHSIRQMLDTAT